VRRTIVSQPAHGKGQCFITARLDVRFESGLLRPPPYSITQDYRHLRCPAGCPTANGARVSVISDPDVNGGEPTLAGTAVNVASVVGRAYAGGMEAAGNLASPAIPRTIVEAAVAYCATRTCDQAVAYCSGCRLRSDAEGIATIDDYLAQFESVRFADTGLEVRGPGALPPRTEASLDALQKSWRAKELFYFARRIIRRNKREIEPRPKKMAGGMDTGAVPAMILVRPQLADNIGMVARAMANFGLDDLRLVDPRDGWPNDKARAAASGADFIVEAAQAHETLAQAIGDLNFVCATTARQRDLAKPVLTPEQAVAEINRRQAEGQRCGILFGPERTGLEGNEIALADAVVMVPVNSRFASLNLAQAALLLGYEWIKANAAGTLGRVTTYEQPLDTGLRLRGSVPATKDELLGFLGQLEGELERLGFFNPGHKREAVMRNIHTMFARMQASEQEVRTLRGIVATLSKGKGHGRKTS
jgi:tRNA/rRNA methyltransferase